MHESTRATAIVLSAMLILWQDQTADDLIGRDPLEKNAVLVVLWD